MSIEEFTDQLEVLKCIASAIERLAVAQERSNLLQEDANKINLAAIGMQQQMHAETLANTGRYMGRLEEERDELKRKNEATR